MSWFSRQPEERNPLAGPWQRRQSGMREMALLRMRSDEEILKLCRSVPGFKFLESLYGFHVFREHPATLQLSFGCRSMFRPTTNLKKTAAEDGPSLCYSLGPDGTIATIVYPVKSDLARVHEDHLFLGLRAVSGVKLLEGMRDDVRDLVAYAHVSSIDMDATWGERLRIGALRIMRPRGQQGEFERAPVREAMMGVTNFATRAAASAGMLAILKPIGLAVALLLLVWFGWEGLAEILRSMIAAK